MRSRIEKLWREHCDASFPPPSRGREINGIDLTLVDADTAGCVSTFLDRGGKIDKGRLAILGLCYHDLSLVTIELDGEDRNYFARLAELAGLILRAVAKENDGE